jgi:hypothetical protein
VYASSASGVSPAAALQQTTGRPHQSVASSDTVIAGTYMHLELSSNRSASGTTDVSSSAPPRCHSLDRWGPFLQSMDVLCGSVPSTCGSQCQASSKLIIYTVAHSRMTAVIRPAVLPSGWPPAHRHYCQCTRVSQMKRCIYVISRTTMLATVCSRCTRGLTHAYAPWHAITTGVAPWARHLGQTCIHSVQVAVGATEH